MYVRLPYQKLPESPSHASAPFSRASMSWTMTDERNPCTATLFSALRRLVRVVCEQYKPISYPAAVPGRGSLT